MITPKSLQYIDTVAIVNKHLQEMQEIQLIDNELERARRQVEYLRKYLFLTQREIAECAQITQCALSRFTRSKINLSDYNLAKINFIFKTIVNGIIAQA